MRLRLVSKRTSFVFSQSHLSTLTAVTRCPSDTADAKAALVLSARTELWVALGLVGNRGLTGHSITVC